MDDQGKNFIRQLLHHAIHSGITSLLWRLPTLFLLVVVILMIAAVWYFKLF